MSGLDYFLTIVLIIVLVGGYAAAKAINQWAREHRQTQDIIAREADIRLENGKLQLEALRRQTELANTYSEAREATTTAGYRADGGR